MVALMASQQLTSVAASSYLRSLQSLTNETQGFGSGPQANQDREVDFDYCYGAFSRHDTNGNQRVDQNEYLAFVQDLGNNTECLGNLELLPIEIMECWNQLSSTKWSCRPVKSLNTPNTFNDDDQSET